MQITTIGTVWRCESVKLDPNGSDQSDQGYLVSISERLPGRVIGQNVYIAARSDDPLEVGKTYRITMQIEYIVPTQDDDDLSVSGLLLDAQAVD